VALRVAEILSKFMTKFNPSTFLSVAGHVTNFVHGMPVLPSAMPQESGRQAGVMFIEYNTKEQL